MFPYLLVAFIAVPLIEIALFIEVGGAIGTFPTVAIVIGTAILGAWLLRQQGFQTARTAQARMQAGEMPVDQAIDGLFLVFAGALLLTPGFMTDAIGFSLFLPQVRGFLRRRMGKWVRENASVHVYREGGGDPFGGRGPDPRRGPQGPRPGGSDGRGPRGPRTIDGSADEIDDIPDGPPRDDSPWRNG